MLIQKKYVLTLGLLLYSAVIFSLFAVFPVIEEIDMAQDIFLNSTVMPGIPVWVKLILFLGAFVCFAVSFLNLCTFRSKVLRHILNATRFCEELGNGRYPSPFGTTSVKNGEVRALLKSLNIIRDRLISSVTRLRSSHSRELEARRISENNAEVKSMLISRIMPEMRLPINNVAGFAELLAAEDALNSSRKQEYIEGIRRAMNLITRHMERIQKVSSIVKNETTLTIRSFRSEELMKQLHEQNDFLLSELSMNLQTPCLPETPEYLRTDQDHLLQILGMMLRAISRVSGAGETLQCTCIQTADGVEFHVSDTGKVPCREELAATYNQLRKDESLNSIGDVGTALLGMIFIDAQATLFGGKLSARKGKKASNEIILSFSAADIAADAPRNTRTQTFHCTDTPIADSIPLRETEEFDGREYSILIGESDNDSAMILEDLFRRNHFHTCRAVNGDDLQKCFAGGFFDAIVLSHSLPCSDILRLIRQLLHQANNPLFPIMVLVSDDTEHCRKELNRAGARCILLKPLNFPLMLRQLRGLCRKD